MTNKQEEKVCYFVSFIHIKINELKCDFYLKVYPLLELITSFENMTMLYLLLDFSERAMLLCCQVSLRIGG